MHPRNRHQNRYDFARLIHALPALQRFVIPTPDATQQPTIDFTDPAAVRMLNRALLRSLYGIDHWQIPDAYLCPPIPGRADYLHGLADLLAAQNHNVLPRGPTIRVLDIGTGASCIYPLLGHVDYGWSFVGSDIDAGALATAQRIVHANALQQAIQLRRQHNPTHILRGVLQPADFFDVCMCNPPFHASAIEAAQASARKWRKLGQPQLAGRRPVLNFGGQQRELWCRGGELAFVRQLIDESSDFAGSVYWFTPDQGGTHGARTKTESLSGLDLHEPAAAKSLATTALDDKPVPLRCTARSRQ